jgi:hypothetical protein
LFLKAYRLSGYWFLLNQVSLSALLQNGVCASSVVVIVAWGARRICIVIWKEVGNFADAKVRVTFRGQNNIDARATPQLKSRAVRRGV